MSFGLCRIVMRLWSAWKTTHNGVLCVSGMTYSGVNVRMGIGIARYRGADLEIVTWRILIFHPISGNKITKKIIILVFKIKKKALTSCEGLFYFLRVRESMSSKKNTPADA